MRAILFLTTSGIAHLAHGAGVLVHIEILRQAAYTLSLPPVNVSLPLADWLEEHRAFAQPGAFFPDWGYGCLGSDDPAEMAHWPPFLGIAMQYLQDTYPELSSNVAGQQLLSFLLATASHQTADSTWHSIRFRDGLMRVVADVDFGGDYEAAHSILDIGGDTIFAKAFAVQEDGNGFDHLSQIWKVPFADLLAIYKHMGIRINPIKLRYCMMRGFAAVSALRRVGDRLTKRYARRSPFMIHEIEHFHKGSVREAAVSVLPCWKAMEGWIVSGQVPQGEAIWDYCEPMRTINARGKPLAIHIGITKRSSVSQMVFSNTCASDDDSLEEYETILQQELDLMVAVEQDGVLILSTKPFKQKSNSHKTPELSRPHDPKIHSDPFFLTPSVPYSNFGSAITFVTCSSSLQIAVGAPLDTDESTDSGRGSVFVIPIQNDEASSMQPHTECALADMRLRSTNADHSTPLFFGTALVNLTLAGLETLAVLSYHQVELYQMRNDTMETAPFVTIRRAHAANAYENAPIASNLAVYEHRGVRMLALLAPWSGRASQGAVYLFSEATLVTGPSGLILEDADIVLHGTRPYERFGLTLTYLGPQKLLVIGSARKLSFMQPQKDAYAVLWVLDDPSQQKLDTGFGRAAVSEGNFLYVASPDESDGNIPQSGKVRVFHLAPLFSSSARSLQTPWTVTLVRVITALEPTPFGHFGQTLTAAGQFEGIYIGAPGYDDRGALFYLPTLANKRQKALRQRPVGFVTELLAKWFPGPLQKQRLEERAQHAAIHQRAMRSWYTDTAPKPRRGQKLKPIYNVTLAPCVLGYEAGSKFGSTVASSAGGLVIVGAPYSSGLGISQRRAGRVILYEGLRC
ncbi:hypothetical protein BCR37DRAFT_389182 [Protomyces lactucae-debilis]|uniref:Phospholipase C/D domain-containing protein n=1 Tax=Protomyces lactucae-debilis TaxID=2754530 RepID=A0A1Y2F0K9_PROLT|nr:uncharacterized protein BCR37DRAFT_389182 [Protomyces lactucae-debilis]ORY77373.1 hypothetical protein BCR37DRAFT_389182 [Protomyces lactucae-debilis]